jgi:hypothetical protein
MKYKYNKEDLVKIVTESLSKAEVLKKLDLPLTGGNYSTLNGKISKWDIDVSHFTGQFWNQGLRYKQTRLPKDLNEVLTEKSLTNNQRLKERLYKEGLKEPKCEGCGLTDWRGQPITLDLEHVNGDHFDNRIENLQILCPNCHRQTKTWGNTKR